MHNLTLPGAVYAHAAMLRFLSSVLFFLVFTVAVSARQPLVRAPHGSEKTGNVIVVLKKDTSEFELNEVIEKIKNLTDEAQIQRYTEFIEKTITLKIPKDVLRKV